MIEFSRRGESMANRTRSILMCAVALGALLAAACVSSPSRPASTPATVVPPTAAATVAATSTPPSSATPQARAHVVAISAGHGGPNNVGAAHTNAQGETDLVEKALNLDVARRLDQLLRAAGYRTVMIRDGDYSLVPNVSPTNAAGVRAESQARADAANDAGAEVILAIHHNGSADATQSGTSVYYNPDRSFGEASGVLATSIYNAILSRLHEHGYDPTPRGVLNDGQTAAAGFTGNGHTFLLGESAGFRSTRMPGMIGEALFVSNDREAALLQLADTRQAIAQAYKDGIDRYFAWLESQQQP